MFEFYISPDTEKQKLMDMFCVPSIGVSLEQRANQYHFPIELAQKMYALPRYQWDKELEDLIAVQYQKNATALNQSLLFFHHFWVQHTNEYLYPLEAFFQHKIPVYRVLLACYLDVISNWSEPNIVINFTQYKHENVLHSVYSLLFETILSQIFIHIRQQQTPTQLSDQTVWGLSELSACVLLNRLYPVFHNATATGYPQLDKHIISFTQATANQNTLSDFLKQVIAFQLPL